MALSPRSCAAGTPKRQPEVRSGVREFDELVGYDVVAGAQVGRDARFAVRFKHAVTRALGVVGLAVARPVKSTQSAKLAHRLLLEERAFAREFASHFPVPFAVGSVCPYKPYRATFEYPLGCMSR